jgi:isopentenyl phosphate kinase
VSTGGSTAAADALREAGLAPFSLAPSTSLVTDVGRPVAVSVEPVILALEWGLLPVVFGDVVLDRFRGCSICSTESVLVTVAERMARRRLTVERALWAGVTDGVLDARGRTIPEVVVGTAEEALAAAGDAAGTDVTGGMLHRLESTLTLARRGTPSLVFDGTVPGAVEAALAGEPVGGTKIS